MEAKILICVLSNKEIQHLSAPKGAILLTVGAEDKDKPNCLYILGCETEEPEIRTIELLRQHHSLPVFDEKRKPIQRKYIGCNNGIHFFEKLNPKCI